MAKYDSYIIIDKTPKGYIWKLCVSSLQQKLPYKIKQPGPLCKSARRYKTRASAITNAKLFRRFLDKPTDILYETPKSNGRLKVISRG